MENLLSFQIKARNFKCFGESAQGFSCIKPVNLIIGRNNSGKSSLLDLIDYVARNSSDIPQNLWHKGNSPLFIAKTPLTEDELKPIFRAGTSGGTIVGDHWLFGKKFIGVGFEWAVDVRQSRNYINIDECADGTKPLDSIRDGVGYLERIANAKRNPLPEKEIRRIYAERNIVPEVDSGGNLEVTGDGRGVTNIIQNYINKASLPSELIEDTLLNELNKILSTDAHFSDIVCQQLEDNSWEIFLEEDAKGRISLSHSGSGLKTIILVLVYIHLVPNVINKNLSDFVFCFEELENNLHPALLRRLLTYIYDCSTSNKCVFFLTTHSSVEIDFFNKNSDAQILHVTHDGETATCRTVKSYIENRGVLDDLDVRASDLLQSNGIIWVEGPSDRIYLNRWIELWSNGELSEGNHYQCIFYGGRLLSHLSSDDPEFVEESISILKVNKNSAILIDSDKRNQQGRLNETKGRIIQEVERNGGITWVTRGREIENYIPESAIKSWLGIDDVEQVGQYANLFEHLDHVREGVGKKYSSRKPLLAEELCPYITLENSQNMLDLNEKMNQICARIKEWNAL